MKATHLDKLLFEKINKKDLAGLEDLLARGANPNATQLAGYEKGFTALMGAASCQFAEAVELLLAAGANPRAVTTPTLPNSGGCTALFHALTGSDPAKVDPASPNDSNQQLRVINALLRAGADPNSIENNHSQPLWWAAATCATEVVALLLASGANPVDIPTQCDPPLHGAASRNQVDNARLLIKHGAKVDAVGAKGMTALMGACWQGSEDTLQLLIDNGADVNRRADDGKTALIFAAQFAKQSRTERQFHASQRIVETLIHAGADRSVKDTRGYSAFDYAIDSASPLAAEALQKGGQR